MDDARFELDILLSEGVVTIPESEVMLSAIDERDELLQDIRTLLDADREYRNGLTRPEYRAYKKRNAERHGIAIV